MKRIIILLAFITIGSFSLSAQAPPPPPSGATNNNTNGFVGGSGSPGAPIGNGTFILLALASAYAGRKVYVMKTTLAEE